MGRWSHYDTDEERLPEGMTRIGYDADDQTYTFRDADGSIWESAPGNQYGRLHRVSGPTPARDSFEDDDPEAPPPYEYMHSGGDSQRVSWRHEMQPLFNFFLIVAAFLIGVFWYFHHQSSVAAQHPGLPPSAPEPPNCSDRAVPYTVSPGDTCWALAQNRGVALDELMRENDGLDCDKLLVGQTICLPTN